MLATHKTLTILTSVLVLSIPVGALLATLPGCCDSLETVRAGTYEIAPATVTLDVDLMEGTLELTEEELVISYTLVDGRSYVVNYARRRD